MILSLVNHNEHQSNDSTVQGSYREFLETNENILDNLLAFALKLQHVMESFMQVFLNKIVGPFREKKHKQFAGVDNSFSVSPEDSLVSNLLLLT